MRTENELAKRIVRHLDESIAQLDGNLHYRLQAIRERALEAYPKPRHSLSLAWAAHGGGQHRSPFLAWLPFAALILGLLFTVTWHATQQANDLSEIDVHLLAEDLPVTAFIDTGFDAWLEGSSPE